MLAKTFEWYRIIDVKPGAQVIEARTDAAAELSAALEKQESTDLLSLVAGIINGFGKLPADHGAPALVLKTLKKFDPAISEDIQENGMELRSSAATAVGERLANSKTGQPSKKTMLLAAALLSASYSRVLPRERFLRAMIEELSGLARAVFENAAQQRRSRKTIEVFDEEGLAAETVEDLQKIVADLQDQVIQLNRNAKIDREEINILWFINAGFSKSRQEPYSSIKAAAAGAHVAADLAAMSLAPPHLSIQEVIAAMMQRGREAADLKPQSLKVHVQNWSEKEWECIAPSGSVYAAFSVKAPVALPFTWLANRMRTANTTPNWNELPTSPDSNPTWKSRRRNFPVNCFSSG